MSDPRTPDRRPTPIRDDPASRAAFEAILAIKGSTPEPGPDGPRPGPIGLCIDTCTDALTLVRWVPIASLIVTTFTGRTHRASVTDLWMPGVPAPVEPSGALLVARRNRIAAEEMRRETEMRIARGRRAGPGSPLPDRPPHDPHERPDAPPEAVGA